jgi:hypothetical protein
MLHYLQVFRPTFFLKEFYTLEGTSIHVATLTSKEKVDSDDGYFIFFPTSAERAQLRAT